MLLRNSISNTKRFFQKTLQGFKSFFSGGSYEKLPRTPPFNPFPYTGSVDVNVHPSYKDMDKFYTDFTDRWDSDKQKAKKRTKKKIILTPKKQEKEVDSGSFMKFAKASPVKNINHMRDHEHSYTKMKSVHEGKRKEDSCSKVVREARSCLVAQKLKELEMMDVSNVDHVLDIEEVLHYYSRLTCPAYLDIVDNFFMDVYAEFFARPYASSAHSINSRPRPRLVKS